MERGKQGLGHEKLCGSAKEFALYLVNGKSLKQVVKLRAFRLQTGNRKEWDTRGSGNCKTSRARGSRESARVKY